MYDLLPVSWSRSPTVGMTWGTPRSYGRNEIGSPCSDGRNDFGACLVPTVGMGLVRLVPTVGMTWGTPRSYGRNEVGSPCTYGTSFLR